MTSPHATDTEGREQFVPTSARGRRTRAKLVDAARQVFLDVGYGEASATLITSTAGVSYGSFYVYFASKSEIFAEVAGELLEQVYLASRAPSEVNDPIERLTTENRVFFDVYRENARIFQVIEEAIHADDDFRQEWQRIRRRNVSRLARGLRRLQDSGEVTLTAPADALADALGAMAERLAYLTTIDDSVTADARIGTLTAIWRQALGLAEPT